MEYEERDYEGLIIQKLDNMKDFLESFMSSLEESDRKGMEGEIPVRAPVDGKIHRWYFSTGDEVVKRTKLGEIDSNIEEQDRKPPDLHPVYSPARGTLIISLFHLSSGARVYGRGTPIATIKTGSSPY